MGQVVRLEDVKPGLGWKSRAEIADHLGICERTVSRWVSRGMPHARPAPNGPLKFKVPEVDAWMRAQQDTA